MRKKIRQEAISLSLSNLNGRIKNPEKKVVKLFLRDNMLKIRTGYGVERNLVLETKLVNLDIKNVKLSIDSKDTIIEALGKLQGSINASNGGGGGIAETMVTRTLEELKTDITNAALVPGALYEITGVHKEHDFEGLTVPALYDDGRGLGTTIYLKAVSTTELESKGSGVFYNPKYNKDVSGYGIWTDKIDVSLSNIVGDFYFYKEEVTANNGARGRIISKGWIEYISGDWSGASSIEGNDSGATADIMSVATPEYNINDIVFWGGYAWKNLNGEIGSKDDSLTLDDTEWEKLDYTNGDYYNKVIDVIEYDIEHDVITRRTDTKNDIDVTTVFLQLLTMHPVSSISLMQWGNDLGISGGAPVGLAKIKVGNTSYAELVNFRGGNIFNVSFDNNGNMSNVSFDNGGYMYNVSFDNGGYMNNVSFDNGGYMYNVSFDNGGRMNNVSFDNGYMYNVSFDNGYMYNVSFYNGNMSNVSFYNGNMSNVSFDIGGYMSNVSFYNGNMSNVSFDKGGYMSAVSFYNGNMSNVSFYNGNMSNVSFDIGGYMSNVSFNEGGYMNNVSFNKGGYMNNVSFYNGNMSNVSFDNIYIHFNDYTIVNKSIQAIDFKGKNNNSIIFVDLTNATKIFDSSLFDKRAFAIDNSTLKLQYWDNNTNQHTIVNIDE